MKKTARTTKNSEEQWGLAAEHATKCWIEWRFERK